MRHLVRLLAVGTFGLLAGCVEQPQPAPNASSYIPHYYSGGNYPPGTPSGGYGYSSYYQQVYPQNPFFRPPAPSAVQSSTSTVSLISPAEAAPPPRIAPPPVASPEPPSTPTDSSCGWWDPCHLWQH
jgi:hypothetical protein